MVSVEGDKKLSFGSEHFIYKQESFMVISTSILAASMLGIVCTK